MVRLAIKNLKMLLVITLIVIIICLTLYIVSPHTYTGKIVADYSERYYELLNKNPLTEEEREELIEERNKVDFAVFKEYESIYKFKQPIDQASNK